MPNPLLISYARNSSDALDLVTTQLVLWKSPILKPEITSPDLTLARQLFSEPGLGPKAKFTEWVKRGATAGYWWCSKVNMTKCFIFNHFYLKINTLDCFNSNWRGNVRRCEKILYAGPTHFDKLKYDTGPTPKARPDLQQFLLNKNHENIFNRRK